MTPPDDDAVPLPVVDHETPVGHPDEGLVVTEDEAAAGLAAYQAVDDLHDGDNGIDSPVDPVEPDDDDPDPYGPVL